MHIQFKPSTALNQKLLWLLVLISMSGVSFQASADYLIGSCTIRDPVDPPHGTECPGQDMTGLDLSNVGAGIDLRFADFSSADLTNADFTNSDLSGANLNGAIITGTTFTGVIWDHTVCPNGFNSEAHVGQGCDGAYQDTDSDGVTDAFDAFPSNAAASIDSDSDGHPDYWDEACDGACQSGSGLFIDDFPNNDAAHLDADHDGFPDAWNDGANGTFNCDATCKANSGLALDVGLNALGAIFVDASKTAGTGDGLSWATAWPKLQDALAVVVAGQEIWVAKGVYYPDEVGVTDTNTEADAFNLKNKTAIVGGFVGNETKVDQSDPLTNITVLSGDIDQNDTNVDINGVHTGFESVNTHAGTNSHSVVHYGSALFARLTGLVISGGGSGIAGNERGGGIYCAGISLTLQRVKMFYNRSSNEGGAIYCNNASTKLVLDEVEIAHSHTGVGGGGIYITNGGHLEMYNSSITNNRANGGGGIDIVNNSTAIIENSTIAFNDANVAAGISVAGTGALGPKNLKMSFSTVAFNTANTAQAGGLRLNNYVDVELIGTVIAGNTASTAGTANVYRTANDLLTAKHTSFGSNSDGQLFLEGTGMVSESQILTSPSFTVHVPMQVLSDLISNTMFDLGGFTPVLPLPKNSDLKNDISEFDCDSINIDIDQRGFPRPYKEQFNGDLNCDIGAYESNDHDLDGAADDEDAFPENEAGTSDADDDGFPDSWAPGCDATCQTNSGLALDAGLFDAGAIFVDINTPAGDQPSATGLSWSTAHKNLTEALTAAVAGQEIWIAKGVYYPDEANWGNTNGDDETFTLKDNVSLLGGFSGNETKAYEADPVANPVVLSGDVDADNGFPDDSVVNGVHTAFHSTYAHNGTNSQSIVTANSVNSRLVDIIISGGGSGSATGGGINCSSSSLYLKRVSILYSIATTSGGGIYCANGAGDELILEDVHLEGNYAGATGGGIFADTSKFQIFRSTINNNRADNHGGGIFINNSHGVMENSTIAYNSAAYAGGIFVDGNGAVEEEKDLDIAFSTIAFNDADGSGGTDHGGALHITNYANVAADASVFVGNTSLQAGSANIFRDDNSQIESKFSSYGSVGDQQFYLDGTGVGTTIAEMFGVSDPTILVPSETTGAIISNTLAHNGGITMSLPLLSNSPLRNYIPEFECKNAGFYEDQRGVQRPYEHDSVNMDCDVGAYEFNDHDLDAIPDNIDNDDDNDGMDDVWELSYFLDPYFSGDATDDPDGDTLSNLTEYGLNRNPIIADFAEPESALVISPKSYRYAFQFDTATCDSAATPVTYTIKNNDTVSRNITGAITFDNVVNSTDWQIKTGSNTCISSIAPDATCTFDVVFCAPNANGNHAGVIQVPTDSLDTPVLTSALYNFEADPIEAERRLPPVISELVIRNLDQGSTIVTDGNIQSGDLHSYEWTITGYHPTYESSIAFFNCDGTIVPNCGSSFGTNIFDSGLMVPGATAAGTWTYNGIVANTYTYSVNHTLTYNGAETNEYVLRFYRKSGQDVEAGNSSLSGLIPGNIMPLASDYYDTSGRRIIINVVP